MMNATESKLPRHFNDLTAAKEFILTRFGRDLRLATPLGLGKPNQLLNLIYRDVKKNPQMSLKIFTALSLERPHPGSDLEKRFLEPFLERHFGKDYPWLDYVKESKKNKIPGNIEIHEFYMQAGQNLGVESSQRHYTSLNYTHVASSLLAQDLQCVVQLVAKRTVNGRTTFSLSCNPDLTLDLVDLFKKANKELAVIGVVHPDLPFLGSDAEVEADFFTALVDSPEVRHELFALPRAPLEPADHAIGLYASQLIMDGGTLQIGIGSLADAIICSTLLRHRDNSAYQRALERLWQGQPLPSLFCQTTPFRQGLYGTSEMVMDAFMHLRQAGILTREIFDLDEARRFFLHGAFFLGSKSFYRWLRELSPDDYAGLSMTRVSKVNDLYDPHELALRRQRKLARFFNTCMSVNLLGGAASETLPDGQVISGVGGQYNFVAMSHELPDSHSVLLLRAVREKKGQRLSNIVWSQGQLTIPRHLRDVVITEYGIAALKGRSDEEVIKALLNIADSTFQAELLATAKKNGKLSPDYEIPAWARRNTPERLQEFFASLPRADFPPFPFGSDFTPAEENLSLALRFLQKAADHKWPLPGLFLRGLGMPAGAYENELARLKLAKPRRLKDWIYQKVILASLKAVHCEILD